MIKWYLFRDELYCRYTLKYLTFQCDFYCYLYCQFQNNNMAYIIITREQRGWIYKYTTLWYSPLLSTEMSSDEKRYKALMQNKN